jgi:hypothetical protein
VSGERPGEPEPGMAFCCSTGKAILPATHHPAGSDTTALAALASAARRGEGGLQKMCTLQRHR